MIYLCFDGNGNSSHIHEDCTSTRPAGALHTLCADLSLPCSVCGRPLSSHDNTDLRYFAGAVSWLEYSRHYAAKKQATLSR